MIGESVIIWHPVAAAPGELNEKRYTFDEEHSDTIDGCAVAPGPSTENLDRQATVDVELTVYIPDQTVTVEPNARVTVRGTLYEVTGKPQDWRNPWTDRRGTVIELAGTNAPAVVEAGS